VFLRQGVQTIADFGARRAGGKTLDKVAAAGAGAKVLPRNGHAIALPPARLRPSRGLKSSAVQILCGERTAMTTIEFYRENAADCMRLAAEDAAESDRPLWATLARSWLQLAEEVSRLGENADAETAEPNAADSDPAEPTPETADAAPAQN
jgi:hypothetical protein